MSILAFAEAAEPQVISDQDDAREKGAPSRIPYTYTNAEELALVALMKKQDVDARHSLIVAEIPFIRFMIKSRVSNDTCNWDDLQSKICFRLLTLDLSREYEPRPGGRFRMFVAGLVKHQIQESLKIQKRQHMLSLDDDFDDEQALIDVIPSPTLGPEELAALREEIAFISHFLDKIPPLQREIFYHRFVNGEVSSATNSKAIGKFLKGGIRDAAQVFDIHEATARRHDSKARFHLLQALIDAGFYDQSKLGVDDNNSATYDEIDSLDSCGNTEPQYSSDNLAEPRKLSSYELQNIKSIEFAKRIAHRLLSEQDAFLFSAVHLVPIEEQIAIPDLAETLGLSIHDARWRLSKATNLIISNMPEDPATLDFINRIHNNCIHHKSTHIEFLDESLMDTRSSPAIGTIVDIAYGLMSPMKFYVFSATHLYSASYKKPISLLASELRCSVRTVIDHIEHAKKTLVGYLIAQDNPLSEHPVFIRRIYSTEKDDTFRLPFIPQDKLDYSHPGTDCLHKLSLTLFDQNDHFAFTAFFLLPDIYRMTGPQIADALNMSESGVRQKLSECRAKIKLAISLDSAISYLSTHPAMTSEDRYHTSRRMVSGIQNDKLALDTLCAEIIYKRACLCLRDNPKVFTPFVRAFLYKAECKQSLEEMASDLGYSVLTLKAYIADARTIMKADLAETYPGLENHAILRQRTFQKPEEALSSGTYITPDRLQRIDDRISNDLKWASVLLNRENFYIISWCLMARPREMKSEFNICADLMNTINYSALIKAFSEFKKMAMESDALERAMNMMHFTISKSQKMDTICGRYNPDNP